MFFRKKFERARQWQREQNAGREAVSDEDLPSMEELREESNKLELEKGDLPALILSAMLAFIPVALIALLVLCAVALLFI